MLARHKIPVTSAGVPIARVGVVNGHYTLIPNIEPVEMVYDHIRVGIKNVVELGSGRGNNIFKLALMLGKAADRIKFHALEYTDSGQEITKAVASLNGALDIAVHYFNYLAPDLSVVPDDGPTLFFSIHSIEQVAQISPDLYEQILKRQHPVTILHFEPVGWQRNPYILAEREANNIDFLNAMIAARLDDIESEECQIINSATHSWRGGYNINLLKLVNDFSTRGLLTVAELVYDFTTGNPGNPTTFIKLLRNQDCRHDQPAAQV